MEELEKQIKLMKELISCYETLNTLKEKSLQLDNQLNKKIEYIPYPVYPVQPSYPTYPFWTTGAPNIDGYFDNSGSYTLSTAKAMKVGMVMPNA